VKIGIAILRADPKETQTQGARQWAIGLIEDHTGRKFSPEAKTELLGNQLGWYEIGEGTAYPDPPSPQAVSPSPQPK
jgi:hypothetical protein